MTKSTKHDRRSLRTRQNIKAALVDLLLEKQYGAITVQDILDRANVGRSTFYEHYEGKEDLLTSSLQDMLHGLGQHAHENQSTALFLPSLELFKHVKDQHRLYRAFAGGYGIELISRNWRSQLSKFVERNLTALVPVGRTPAVPLPVLADFIAGAFLTLLEWWLENHTPYSPEEINQMFTDMVYPGVKAALGIT